MTDVGGLSLAHHTGTPMLPDGPGLADTWRDPDWAAEVGVSHGEGMTCGACAQKALTRGRQEGPAGPLGRVPGASQGLSAALKIALEPAPGDAGVQRRQLP